MAKTCKVGLTDDFLLEDGSLSFPGYDLGGLVTNPRIEIVRVAGGSTIAAASLRDINILISVPMTAGIDAGSLGCSENLLGVIRVGVGCEDVDLQACTDAGVAVVVPADAVRRPTAIAALTLILALATRLLEKNEISRLGPEAWDLRAKLRGRNLEGRVLGLVGCGNIGSDLAALVQPMGMRVMAYDPAASPDGGVVEYCDLDAVLAQADYLSIHCPLNSSTRGLIDARRIATMRPGAYLINTARGGIVDQDALADAIRSGHLAGAGLDVFDPEPLPTGHVLLDLPGVVLSAHALNWTEGLDADLAAQNVSAVMDLAFGRIPHRVVNPAVLEGRLFQEKQQRLISAL